MLGLKSVLGLALAGVVFSNIALAQSPATTSMLDKPSATESKRRTTGDFELSLGGMSEQEGKDSSEGAYVYFSPNFNFQLTNEFRIKLSPWARFYSQRAQSRWGDSDGNGFIFLYDAYAAYEPIKWFEAKAGVISQSGLHNSMLVSNYASFPGAQLNFKDKVSENFEWKITGQTSIPTSQSDNSERNSNEPTPRFTTLSADLNGKVMGVVTIKSTSGLFEWKDMPSKIVYKSRQNGNVGFGEITPGSKLAYEHKGYFTSVEACYCDHTPVGFVGEFKRIHNTEAPGDSADAQMFGFGPKVKWKGMEFDFRYRSFFIESDATIAHYNKSRFGHTNRIGENLEASVHFVDQKFTLFAEMYKARPLNQDPNQRNMELFFFGVETDNVSFF